jgi:hypothetical protein
MRKIASSLALVALVACGGGGDTDTSHAASIRVAMATRFFGEQLDCVVAVVAERYSESDWVWVVANAATATTLPPHFRDLKRKTDDVMVGECAVDRATLSTVDGDGTVHPAKRA